MARLQGGQQGPCRAVQPVAARCPSPHPAPLAPNPHGAGGKVAHFVVACRLPQPCALDGRSNAAAATAAGLGRRRRCPPSHAGVCGLAASSCRCPGGQNEAKLAAIGGSGEAG